MSDPSDTEAATPILNPSTGLAQAYNDLVAQESGGEAEAAPVVEVAPEEDPDVTAAAGTGELGDEAGGTEASELPAATADGEVAAEEGQDAAGGTAADPNARAEQDLERRDREVTQREQHQREQLVQAQNIQAGFSQLSELARTDPIAAARHMGMDTARLMQQLINVEPEQQVQQAPQVDPQVQQNQQTANAALQETRTLRVELALERAKESYPVLSQMAAEGGPAIGQIAARVARGEAIGAVAGEMEASYTEAYFDALGKFKDDETFRSRIANVFGFSGNGAKKVEVQPATTTQQPAAQPAVKPQAQQTLRQDMKATPAKVAAGGPRSAEEGHDMALEILKSQPMFLEDEPIPQALVDAAGLGKKE